MHSQYPFRNKWLQFATNSHITRKKFSSEVFNTQVPIMNLFFNKFFNNIPMIQPSYTPNRGNSSYGRLQGPQRDTFQRINSTRPTFTGKRSTGSTKKGDVLKELDNITCPYSGVKMVSSKKMDEIEKDLSKCINIRERMDVLEPYKNCMQKLERGVFNMFRGYECNNPYGTINDCLNELKPACLTELRIEQFKVLDEVDKISNRLNPETAFAVRKVTTDARKKIIEDRQDSIFKRKDLLAEIHDITKDYPDQSIVAEMWAKANMLPKSTNNFNAFVVKYANRSPLEISSRLLRPSVASIEHIRPANPDSLEVEVGEDNLTNFMLASRDWNSGRSNTPLPDFIKRHPNIPKYTQKYMDDIIKAIHKRKLKDCDWYPYVIKEKLYNESQGLINITLDKYKHSKEEAFEDAPQDVIDTYEKLLEANKSIPAKG